MASVKVISLLEARVTQWQTALEEFLIFKRQCYKPLDLHSILIHHMMCVHTWHSIDLCI